MADNQPASNELRAVVILSLGFGLVGIDRFLISTMFPAIARDLSLDYGDIGTIAGVLAFAWGVAALVMGNAADRIGRRKVLVGSLIVFSLLIGASGLAAGLLGLIAVRVVMGFADGAFTPASISATIACSAPDRHGRNIGIQQMSLALFGLGLAPLLVAYLIEFINWRWIFLVFTLPGLVVAWATWRWIPDSTADDGSHLHHHVYGHGTFANWRQLLGYRNIKLLMVLMLCWLTCLITTSAFMPSYLIDHLGLSEPQMGGVMSAIGFGSAAGALILSWLSDKVGRKPVMVLCTLGAFAALWNLSLLSAGVTGLFLTLFAVHFFNNAAITLTVGPICAETVPVSLMATASGMVIAVGELLGGGLAPMAAGQFADRFGIAHILWLPLGAIALGFVLSLFLIETHPRKKEMA
ncbi:MFS transporter [Rhizorhabdus dicambivorans]|uniref:MFS transporter n=1 Tax=Rhizorhabdus dicambivorans TaxID=1850238 RepID=A0A2A4FR48_9SPHN|nr:MFS transporter [Rhizorhabdus dicambivorans]ATE65460.1 MFS transporter [Rhizorhabdus dicambivorans]PCE39881.1 MFS transporter [Rhizorhabdus dicambivorans]